MSNTCKYEKYRRWISYDSGITWSPMNEYQKGELIERDSVDCGWEPTPPTPEVEYRWVDIPLADDFYCSGTTKYYKQKMQQSEDSGTTWTDVVPPQYRMGASAQSESSDCGYASRTTSGSPYCDDGNKVVMIYYQVSDDHGASWTTTSSTENIIEYDVAECGYATRTTSGSPYCVGVDKCVDLYHQVTRDGGTTWTTTSTTVSVIERNSEDCGYVPPTPEVEYRWVDLPLQEDYYCNGVTKYYKQKMQQSTDSGSTWSDVVPPQYRMGASAESKSSDCGYAERTTSGSPYCVGVDKCVDVYHQESEDSGTSWTTTSTTVSVIERNSEDCGYVPPTPPTPSYSGDYLTFRARENGSFNFNKSRFVSGLSYSLDSGLTWVYLQDGDATPTVKSGETVMWKGEMSPTSSYGIGTFTSTGSFDVEGNPMSLLYGDYFGTKTTLEGKDYAFYGLFSGCAKLINAENLILSATTLAARCYNFMFQDCTSLTTVPELPATTLADSCYNSMFRNCTSLTTVPSDLLPATELAEGCYWAMFDGCTSLTTAPELPAMILATSCYNGMFNGCTSLTTAPELPATTLAWQCYQHMFYGCTSLTTAPSVLPATTLEWNCYAWMFYGCESLTTALELPATTLTSWCYYSMFAGCTSLTAVTCLATDISANSCTAYWLRGVASAGTFTKAASMNDWEIDSDSGIPNGWTVGGTSVEYRWVDIPLADAYYCVGTSKYYKQKRQKSYDNGSTWIDVVPPQYGIGASAQSKSVDCGYIPPTPQQYELQYLTFIAKEDGTFTFSGSSSGNKIQYSLDSGATWSSPSNNITTQTLHNGNTILWKGEMSPTSSYGIGTFTSTGAFDVQGNIMSLLYGDNFERQISLEGKQRAFGYLFSGCTHLLSAENLSLPATTLAANCYYRMFQDCTSLTTVPELPATTLANSCYYGMFRNCTSITTVPSDLLPATTLAYDCYYDMFRGCTSLTTTPQLPATTLASGCYFEMFQGCTSLTTAPELSATTLANSCYGYMFAGCTSLTTAPILPATTLATWCYGYMFQGCTSLSAITCQATKITSFDIENALRNWVSGVASAGTFTKAANMGWPSGDSGIPNGWTVIDAEWRWVDIPLADDFYCSGTTKYYKQKMQQSEDSGSTWSDVVPPQYRIGASAQSKSVDCGYITRTITRTSCDNGNKMFNTYYQESEDGGIIWETTSTTVSVLEYDSAECGYQTRWVSGSTYCSGTTKMITMYHEESRDYGQTWSTIGTSENVVEYDSEDCGESQYLTFIAREDGTFRFTKGGLSYSLDSGTTWVSIGGNTSTPTIQSGNAIMWKGELTVEQLKGIGRFSSTGAFDVEGNVMSLLYGDNYGWRTTLEGKDYAFYGLFSGCTKLYSAENLILPATTLSNYSYGFMFDSCTSLTTAPALLATTMVSHCYGGMFYSCTSLTTAPQLPATILAYYCYMMMFYGCTSLTTAPILSVETLAEGCYYYMFQNCTSLTSITCLAKSGINSNNSTFYWVDNVAASGTFIKDANTTWPTGRNGIPNGWTVEDYQP